MRRKVVMGEGWNMDIGAYGRTHMTLVIGAIGVSKTAIDVNRRRQHTQHSLNGE